MTWARWRRWRDAQVDRLGGPSRARVIVTLALVLGLDAADFGAVGALAGNLRDAMGLSQAQLGLLVTVSEGVGAITTLFFGWLADRTNRTRALAIAVLCWGVAIALCGFASGYVFLLMTRLGVGAVTAAATPFVASLLGDYFPQSERAKIYGLVLTGELIGTGFGFLGSGLLASLWWRLGFWILAVPAIPLAWALLKLREPARGGASQLRGRRPSSAARFVADEAAKRGIQPRADLVRGEDLAPMSPWRALRYLLRIRTNIVLIGASALGYFFFSGARVFAVELLHGAFHLGHASAVTLVVGLGSGAMIGVLVSGWLSDRLLARGHLRARVKITVASVVLCATFFLIGLWAMSVWVTLVTFFLGAAALGAMNPPLDAARLDVVAPSLWGRAESMRMSLRKLAEAGAPPLVGYLAVAFGGHASGMRDALLLSLVLLYVGAGIGVVAFKSYLPDAVTAEAYAELSSRAPA